MVGLVLCGREQHALRCWTRGGIGAVLCALSDAQLMQRAVPGLPPTLSPLPRPRCLIRCSSSLRHRASVSVLEKPWGSTWILCTAATSGIPTHSGMPVLHPAQILPVLPSLG